jgi:dTDP-4-amino-4,6-dideoxygalactose transaminase
MKVPLMDLSSQYKELKGKIDRTMEHIAESSSFVLGKETEDFERDISSYCGVRYAIGVASGTDALILALTSLGIKQGDEVITTPLTFVATAEAISRVGAKPVFVDIEPSTFNIDPEKIVKAITADTKAIIPVHLYGNPCNMDAILEIAKKHKLKVIEDAAQAIGAVYRGRRIGALGDIGCFSFFPSKNLGAFGDAGMIVTDDSNTAGQLKLLRVHGSRSKYLHSIIGFNSRLDNLQAAILAIKLQKLEEWTDRRRRIARRYDSALQKIVIVPEEQPGTRHVYHLYVIRVKGGRRDELLKFLNKNGIEARSYYSVPLHLQECYKELGHKEGAFPETEKAASESLALPLFAELETKQQDYVIKSLQEYLGK